MIYPIALEAVQRINALFDVERAINGKATAERLAMRRDLSGPLMAELHTWLTAQLAGLEQLRPRQGYRLHASALRCLPASSMTAGFA